MKDMRYMAMALIAALTLAAGCAVEDDGQDAERTAQVFQAWVNLQKTRHPEYLWRRTPLGCYILEESAGTGEAVGSPDDSPYVTVSYTITDQEGNITETNRESAAKLLGTWDQTYYYGASVSFRGNNSMYAGIEEVLPDMQAGGRVKVLIPYWLLSNKRYSKEKTYIKNVTSGTTSIYDIEVKQRITDIDEWMADSLKTYVDAHFAKVDTVITGCYYECLSEGTEELSSGSQYYISYTGRRTDGQVFDTTDENTAIDEHIYSSSKTYGDTYITWNSDYTEITMGADATELIEGFQAALGHMKLGEKGRALITPALAYKASAQGKLIPAYSPLLFEIEIIKAK